MNEISTEDCEQVKPRFVFQIFFLIFLIFALSTTVLYFVLSDATFVYLSVISFVMMPIICGLETFVANYHHKILLEGKAHRKSKTELKKQF